MPALFALILKALEFVIIADVVLSWVMPDATRFPRKLTTQITEPLYAPIHAVLKPERSGGLDFAPLLVILLIQLMQSMLRRAM
jgi:YggT family protein